MRRFKLRVAAPCSQDWSGMAGDDRARFCTSCALTVHDLSAISDADARALLAGPEERLCVRFATRPDGTIVTGGRGRWLGSALGALALAVAAVVFWTSVTLLQRPWRVLARKLAASTSPVPVHWAPSKDDEERSRAYDELMKRLAASRDLMMSAGAYQGSMGAVSSGERGAILGSWGYPPKHAKRSRR